MFSYCINQSSLTDLLLHSAVTVFPALEKSGVWLAPAMLNPVSFSNVSVPPLH